jgi:hypothetical protein
MKLTAERLRQVLDYDPVAGIWRWKIRKYQSKPAGAVATGRIDTHGYRQLTIDGVSYLSSRLAFLYVEGVWPEKHVDHRNTDTLDDRWENLRHADRSQNGGNRNVYSNNTLGVKGVSPRKNGKFVAQIQRSGRKIFLGYHDTVELAKSAYDTAAAAVFEEFHRT